MSDFKIVSLLNPGGVSQVSGVLALSASTQVQTSGTVHFVNSNGVTFGLSSGAANATITASVAGGAAGSISAGTTRGTLGEVVFSNSNGVSFGMNAQTVTAQHNALTSQSNQNVTAANGGFAFQTLSFSNANAFSFGTSAGSAITGSYTVPTVTNSSWTASDNVTSMTIGRLAFTNSNGMTFTLSTTTGGSATLIGSYTRPVVSNAIASVGSATNSGTNTSRFAADDHIHAGVFSMGVSNDAGNTVGDTRVDVGRFVLRGGPNITLSQITAANALNTIVVSAPAAGAATVSSATTASSVTTGNVVGADAGRYALEGHQHAGLNRIGVSTLGNTAGNTTLGHFRSIYLSGQANITLSQVTDANSDVTIGISGPSGGGGGTLSFWYEPRGSHETTVGQLGNGSFSFFPILMQGNLSFSRADILASISVSSSSNSSHAGNISLYVGIYTRNVSTLSLASSGSQSVQWTNTSNNSLGSITALRRISAPVNANMTPGNYWIGVMSRTSTSNANWFTGSWMVASQDNTGQWVGLIGEASNVTKQVIPGWGHWSTTSTNLPASVAFSHITGIGATGGLTKSQCVMQFVNFTV
jgi:hypothetical protein